MSAPQEGAAPEQGSSADERDAQIAPAYGGQSIVNLHRSLLDAFGVDSGLATPPISDPRLAELLGGARRIIVYLIDALGYRALQQVRTRGELPLLERLIAAGSFLPLTSVFPSATNNVLQSFHTGLPPLEHGFAGYRLYLEEPGVVGEMIQFTVHRDGPKPQPRESLLDHGVKPEDFALPTLFERLSWAGIPSTVVFRHNLLASHLSSLNHRGCGRIVPFVDTADQMVRLRELLRVAPAERDYIYTYWDSIDTIQHVYGAAGEAMEAELAKILFSLERELLSRLTPEDASGVVLLVVSDHGQINVPREGYVSLFERPEVLEHLERPLAGNERVSYLRAKEGHVEALHTVLGHALPAGFRVVPTETVLTSGLLGPGEPHEALRSRLGDLVVFAPPGRALDHREEEKRAGGMHGGLTSEEMLIPCLAVDLGLLCR